MTEPRQLVLDLAHRAAYGREDFLVAPSNAAAVALIDGWPNWPAHAAIIVGQDGSGKSHLAQVWQMKSNSKVASLSDLTQRNADDLLATGALCLERENARLDETALFHALNIARQTSGHVLITTREEPSHWGLKLPDLVSRLKALPIIPILPPDDTLLRAVLVKLFADRQIMVDEAIVAYMLARMPRSLADARHLVAEIDRRALIEKAEVTRPFVAKILGNIANPQLFEK